MDLSPFAAINPCGYPDLRVTQMCDLGVKISSQMAGEELIQRVINELDVGAASSPRKQA